MVDSFRDMLNQLERDLTTKIDTLRRQLAPLERELADVRRAKSAISQADTNKSSATQAAKDITSGINAPTSPYRDLTMKQLAIKALREHFPNGATAIQLLKFFESAWGRKDVVRESLSPQLSRLKKEKRVTLDGKTWHLAKNEAPTEDQSEGASKSGGGDSPSNERRKIGDLLA